MIRVNVTIHRKGKMKECKVVHIQKGRGNESNIIEARTSETAGKGE